MHNRDCPEGLLCVQENESDFFVCQLAEDSDACDGVVCPDRHACIAGRCMITAQSDGDADIDAGDRDADIDAGDRDATTDNVDADDAFDDSGDHQDDDADEADDASCVPLECGSDCGIIEDGCDGSLDCGECPDDFMLTVEVTGNPPSREGNVTSQPEGIDCEINEICSAFFDRDTTVMLRAEVFDADIFMWLDDASECGLQISCEFIMDSDKIVRFSISDI